MTNNVVETVIGAIVLVIALMFVIFAYRSADVTPVDGYELMARFDRINGLTVGSDVRMSGIKIGTVTDETLDTKTFLAVVKMNISSDLKVPDDSSIKISTDGLLGDTYLSLEPGGSEDVLAPGGEIQFTQGSIDIIDLVGKAIYSSGSGGGSDSGDGG